MNVLSRIEGLENVSRYVPWFGLAVSIPFALLTGPGTTVYTAVVLGLAATAALWMFFVGVAEEQASAHQARAIVFYVVLLVHVGLLVALNPFFGFFAFSGYLLADLLPGRWKAAGLVVTAFIISSTQIGGIRNLHGGGWIAYGALVTVNICIVGVITYARLAEERRSAQRAQMIDELAEVNRRLRETMEENAGLHAQLVTQAREAGVLDERQRMAGEIHDTIAQGLTGIVTQLEAAVRTQADTDRHTRHLELARRMARESLTEARRSVQALRPGPLAEAHLPEAIADLTARFEETSGLSVRLEVSGSAVPLSPALEVVLFRTAQEALQNIAKHAGATHAGVTLSYTHEVVMLDVLDDGRGFIEDETARDDGSGYGLTAMRQRLRQVGGTLTIESTPGEGTTISAGVPALQITSSIPPTTSHDRTPDVSPSGGSGGEWGRASGGE